MDNASSIKDRLDTLKELHNNVIHTVLFMLPIFPYITNFKDIIELNKDYINEYWFENLNLRGDYKTKILFYIQEIKDYCENNNINYINYFYHEELVKSKELKK